MASTLGSELPAKGNICNIVTMVTSAGLDHSYVLTADQMEQGYEGDNSNDIPGRQGKPRLQARVLGSVTLYFTCLSVAMSHLWLKYVKSDNHSSDYCGIYLLR